MPVNTGKDKRDGVVIRMINTIRGNINYKVKCPAIELSGGKEVHGITQVRNYKNKMK